MCQPHSRGRSCWAAVNNKIGDQEKIQSVSSHDPDDPERRKVPRAWAKRC
jgi:hypothetical protein